MTVLHPARYETRGHDWAARCAWCGRAYSEDKRFANNKQLFCSRACKQKAYRARHNLNAQEVECVCAYCYGHFKTNRLSGKAYCSNACRQAMYRARKANGGQTMF